LTTSTASAIDCKVYPGNSSERLLMKQECGLFYEYGILIQDGATVKNCNVKKFWSGGFIEDGGVIENSHFSLNNVGVTVSNEIPNTMSKVLKRCVRVRDAFLCLCASTYKSSFALTLLMICCLFLSLQQLL
jgi:hypothetical protein